MTGINDRRNLMARSALLGSRGFDEQYRASKDQLRAMLADAVRNTAAQQTEQHLKLSDHE